MGSTSITTDDSGDTVSEMRYSPWGSVRFSDGDSPTDIEFNGQRSISYIKLIKMGSRWYDQTLGRFTQADPIIPGAGNPISWDRYSFVMNNPLRFIDPSGNYCMDSGSGNQICSDDEDWSTLPKGNAPQPEPDTGDEDTWWDEQDTEEIPPMPDNPLFAVWGLT
jgi:RHS repeat-associated protein